ncbi:retinol dehydrogenase 8 isoform X2 [Myxocyprinus asiaticus]|uniref:retinol dehydrogenase 8 isoform X2 n=1 Tax=Myxocyprinus asiaticus TaxID=70543 RepID=UPI002221756A|nr:retinol dehydrogenase 8 isoform X2 [Myxocyprinus asiaticus]XP_051569771.1 retinol dehydrogenase 8 isoform X2 [Myxocyprinus asiaticus]XP_051569772.1 retinol dehydrogenase 8 isoform X2 [Myxocyprinus asiaticus]
MGTQRVLVTGCSSGIGLAVAVRLAKDELRRFQVVATMRNLERREALERAAGETLNTSLEIRQLDATYEDSIRECVNSLPDRRVDVLVNNAGMGMIGPLECQSVSAMQELFNTNFFGLVRLVKEVLPEMKRRQNGHIVVMSSVLGIQGMLFNDVYAASKFAVEGFCESLALQAMKFNVKMTLVEPGPVITEFERKVYKEAENMDLSETDEETAQIFRQIYLPNSHKVFTSIGQTPEEVAEQTLQLIVSKNPPFRHLTNRLYIPLTAMKQADPTGRLPIDAFYKITFQHNRMFRASLWIMRMLQRSKGQGAA